MVKENKVSVVITTLNCEKDIAVLLESMVKNNLGGKAEIITVDAGSTDNTCEVIKRYSFVKLISAPGTLRGAGRNIGIKESKGEFIAFLDGDTEITASWYDELLGSIKMFDVVTF